MYKFLRGAHILNLNNNIFLFYIIFAIISCSTNTINRTDKHYNIFEGWLYYHDKCEGNLFYFNNITSPDSIVKYHYCKIEYERIIDGEYLTNKFGVYIKFRGYFDHLLHMENRKKLSLTVHHYNALVINKIYLIKPIAREGCSFKLPADPYCEVNRGSAPGKLHPDR